MRYLERILKWRTKARKGGSSAFNALSGASTEAGMGGSIAELLARALPTLPPLYVMGDARNRILLSQI